MTEDDDACMSGDDEGCEDDFVVGFGGGLPVAVDDGPCGIDNG